MLTATDWVAVGGVAQLIAAAATISLAVVTAIMAIKTRDVAIETRKESGATQALATEAKRDRELAWRPQLSLVEFNVAGATEQTLFTSSFKIRNSGGGPAIDCRVAAHLPEDINFWWLTSLGDLPAGSVSNVGNGSLHQGSTPYEIFDYPHARESDPIPDVMMFCTDAIGRRLRFPVAGAFDGLHSKPYMAPDVYVVGEPNQPTWGASPMLWP
jgi:hypothetical protein